MEDVSAENFYATADDFVFCSNCNGKIGAYYRSYGDEYIVFNNLREVSQVYDGVAVDPSNPTRFSLTMSMYSIDSEIDKPYVVDHIDLVSNTDSVSANHGDENHIDLLLPDDFSIESEEDYPEDSMSQQSWDYDDLTSLSDYSESGNETELMPSANSGGQSIDMLTDKEDDHMSVNALQNDDEDWRALHELDILAYLNEQCANADSGMSRALDQLQREGPAAAPLDDYESDGLPGDIDGLINAGVEATPRFVYDYLADYGFDD